jgi:hypothetical protein
MEAIASDDPDRSSCCDPLGDLDNLPGARTRPTISSRKLERTSLGGSCCSGLSLIGPGAVLPSLGVNDAFSAAKSLTDCRRADDPPEQA